MRLTLHTVDGGDVTVEDFHPDGVLELLAAMDDPGVPSIRLELDGGASVVQVRCAHIVRVDVDYDGGDDAASG